MIGFMVVFIAFFYFVVIRPQSKKKKEMESMMSNLKKGDKVVTVGGIMGKISSIKDNVITLKVNDSNTEISFEKSAISRVVLPPQASNQKNDKKNDKKVSLEDKSEESDGEQTDNEGKEDSK